MRQDCLFAATRCFSLWVTFLLLSCEKVDLNKVDNLNNGRIEVIGHGGAGFQSLINPLPANSFTSLKKAIDGLNADGVEVDFKVSSDSIAILFHDDVLEKSTNCTGCPESYSGSQMQDCRYKNYYGSRAVNKENLISVQQMIDHFKNRTKLPHIYASSKIPTLCSINDPLLRDTYGKVISKLIRENNAYNWISCFDSDVTTLNVIKSLDPSIDIIYNAHDFQSGLDACLANNYSGMVIKNSEISEQQVKEAHFHNIKVTIWGILFRKETINAINKNPDALMTDNIELTQEVLRR